MSEKTTFGLFSECIVNNLFRFYFHLKALRKFLLGIAMDQ